MSRPADRVPGSIDPYWQIVVERRRRERLRIEMERRERRRALRARVVGWFTTKGTKGATHG